MSDYLMSNLGFVPSVLDSGGSTFKDHHNKSRAIAGRTARCRCKFR